MILSLHREAFIERLYAVCNDTLYCASYIDKQESVRNYPSSDISMVLRYFSPGTYPSLPTQLSIDETVMAGAPNLVLYNRSEKRFNHRIIRSIVTVLVAVPCLRTKKPYHPVVVNSISYCVRKTSIGPCRQYA